MTLNASDVMNGSFHPARYGTTIRWPDDETGRNSVSPCTIPITMAWNSVSTSVGARSPRRGRFQPALPDEQGGQDEGDRREELDEHVQRRACGVLERIADRVADHCCRVGIGALAEDLAIGVLEVA